MKTKIKEILIGTLLGDAHIRATKSYAAYITFEQSVHHKDYIHHIFDLLNDKDLCLNEPKTYVRKDYRYDTITKSIYFRTKAMPEFKFLADIFLDEKGKKTVPLNIAEHLTARSLAYWIMDDGQQVKRGGVTLCTDNYSSEEVNLLRIALKTVFDIDTTIHTKKGGLYERIYIGKSGLNNIKPEIKKFILDYFLYKIHESVD